MVALGVGVLIVGVSIVVGVLLYSLLLLLTAAIANIEERSFGKAVFSTLAACFSTFVVSSLTGFIPIVGQLISLLACIALPVLLTQAIFNTTFVKALVAELLRFLIVLTFSAIMLLITILFARMSAVQGNLSQFINQYGGQLF